LRLLLPLAAVYLPLWCFDFSLVAFHCFLCSKGMTTYEYLTGKTRRPAPKTFEQGGGDQVRIQKTISQRSMASVQEKLPRSVSDFMFGSSEPADPADAKSTLRIQHCISRGSRESTLTHEVVVPPTLGGSPSEDGDSTATSTAMTKETGDTVQRLKAAQPLPLQRAAAQALAAVSPVPSCPKAAEDSSTEALAEAREQAQDSPQPEAISRSMGTAAESVTDEAVGAGSPSAAAAENAGVEQREFVGAEAASPTTVLSL